MGLCFTLFCLAEQTAPGRQEEEERGALGGTGGDWYAVPRCRLGGPDAGGTEGALFFVCFVPAEWGQLLLLSGGLSTVRLYRMPHLSTPLPLPQNHHHSLTHSPTHPLPRTRPSISSATSAGGVQCFVAAQESEQTSSQRKRGLLLCQLPGKSAFYCH